MAFEITMYTWLHCQHSINVFICIDAIYDILHVHTHSNLSRRDFPCLGVHNTHLITHLTERPIYIYSPHTIHTYGSALTILPHSIYKYVYLLRRYGIFYDAKISFDGKIHVHTTYCILYRNIYV